MKLDWAKASRLPRPPAWAAGVVALWGGLVLASVMLERWTGRPLETCLFHRVTGRPCPTCGGTRALVALAGGSVLEALGNNPLVTLLLGAGGGLMLLRAFSGRRLSLQFEGRERAAAMALALVALGLNWWWVWRRGL